MIYCFDLDGTLVTNTEDENGNMHYTEAQPIPEAINRLRKLYESGIYIDDKAINVKDWLKSD